MKYFLLVACLSLISCTKSSGPSAKYDFSCFVEINYAYRSIDTAYYHAHGAYHYSTINRHDTIYGYDSASMLNYMASRRLFPAVLDHIILDTAIYVDSNTFCQRYIH